MSNLTIQSTPKSYLEQYPLSTGQIAMDEEGVVVGNGGDLNTCLFEDALNIKLGVDNLDEAKSLLDVVPITPMPPQGGITFVTKKSSGTMSVILTLCTASTQAQVGGNVTINWGDGSAIQTYAIAATGTTTCTKTANYSTADQKLVTITCVTTTHSVLSFAEPYSAVGYSITCIDGRNCPKLTSLDLSHDISLKFVLGFSGVVSVDVADCYSLVYLPDWENVNTVVCDNCTSLASIPNWINVTSVSCYGCTNISSVQDWPQARTISCNGCTKITSLKEWPNAINIDFSGCTGLTSIPNWTQSFTVGCGALTIASLPNWPNVTSVFCESSPNLTSLPNWQNVTSVTCDSCPNLTSFPNWPKIVALTCLTCQGLTSIPKFDNLQSLTCYGCQSLTDPSTWFTSPINTDPWPNIRTFIIGRTGPGNPPDKCVSFGSNSTYLNNFYALLHSWTSDAGVSGTLTVTSNNTGFATSDTTIATNKDWTVT